jgi:glycosyltransferase involved in cell wall biosynthesis
MLPLVSRGALGRLYLAEKEARRRRLRPAEGDVLPLLSPPVKPDVFIWGVIDWSDRLQRPQHLARGLAKAGHRVFYIAPALVKAPEPGFELEPAPADGTAVHVVRLHLPRRMSIHHAVPDAADTGQLGRSWQALRSWTGQGAAVSIVHHPSWYPLVRRLDHRCIYDCLDLLEGFPHTPPAVAAAERELLAAADGIITTSGPLHEMARRHNDNVVLIRNGVEYDFFADAPTAVFRDPLGRRVLGYFGAMASWLDADLLRRVALRFPQCLVLLVGQDSAGVREHLRGLPNVRLTGEVSYRELPHYLYAMDVCLLPFRLDPLTRATNPVKVYEYLAAGKPVVATALPEMAQFDGLVLVAGDADGFLRCIEQALAQPEPAAAPRRAFAARNTWPMRIEAVERFLANPGRPLAPASGSTTPASGVA